MAKVKPITEQESKEVAPQEQVNYLRLAEKDANAFIQIINIILIGDDRAKAIQGNFIEMIKNNNEQSTEQPK